MKTNWSDFLIKGVLFIVFIVTVSYWIIFREQFVDVTIINQKQDTVLRLVEFELSSTFNKSKIDYEFIEERWTNQKKVFHLKNGLYGVTQFSNKSKSIVDFKEFLINYNEYKPITIIM